MKLPKLTSGRRATLARPSASVDALLLAELATREAAAQRLTAVVTADAADARRLLEELPFFAPDLRIVLFPDWETLPYDNFSPHQDLISERLATLWAIRQGQADVVLIPATTALYRLAPPAFIARYTFDFKQGQKLDEAALKSQLTLAGYSHVQQVVSPGEYAVRGGLIDIFPMGSPQPFRVDLFDDEIDTIRAFDPDTQRSLYPVPEVRLLPGHEFPMDEDGRTQFRNRWRELLPGDPTKSRVYKDVGDGVATAGIEYYLPLFFDQTATLFDYLGAQATLVLHGALEPAFQRFTHDTHERWSMAQGDPDWPVLPPEALFLSAEEFYVAAKPLAQLALRPDEVPEGPSPRPSPLGGEGASPDASPLEGEGASLDASDRRPSAATSTARTSAIAASAAAASAAATSAVGTPTVGTSVTATTATATSAATAVSPLPSGERARERGVPAACVPTPAAPWRASVAPLPDLTVNRNAEDPLTRLGAYLQRSKERALILADSDGRRESLLDFLRASHLVPTGFDTLADFRVADARFGITTAALARGFAWTEAGIALITETELFATPPTTRRRRKQEQVSDVEALIKDLSELKIGDPVVHAEHGVGRYCGLVNLDVSQKNPDGSGAPQEFLHLEYANKAILYVPVSQLHLISRYTGVGGSEAPLHKLGSDQWDRAKRKAAQQVRDAAAELLNIYARRAARQGHAFRYSPADYEQFAADFGFEETPDQRAAIHAVVQDMISPLPMDRLVCGDVGFGKTEVALRAAFIAVTGGKQVALLAPTTLLAEQHYNTLTDRFARWPIKVEQMSRFRTAKQTKIALEGLANGTIDIVVGTHKLLSEKTQFKNLGLLIVDEEHRFGVRQKEQIKKMRAEVDVLTLTATPIPRTMGMAMEGLRDLSVIATAPERRLAIKTFVRTQSNGVIREAILRELKRGGQVYFLHNEVETIENRRKHLEELLPEARIAVAHGQMHERELERVMRDFVAQRINVLLCSTIIETGIDVPTANTIVIERADMLGLAQLHQLRGRVGRSHHQAYAYLLVPDLQGMPKRARQRLDAIQEMEDLGAGFYLAMHDLEIRGAGEVLGENQSGNMSEIGFQLYNDMLAEAVRALKAGREPDLLAPMKAATDIKLHAPALIPSDYCGDVQVRLSLYKRLAGARTDDQLDTLVEEIVDRFGKLPPQAATLMDTHRLRILCTPYGVTRIDAAPTVINIAFRPNPPIDPMAIIHLIQKNRAIKLAGNDKLRIERALPEVKDRVQLVRDVLKSLGKPIAAPAPAAAEPVTA